MSIKLYSHKKSSISHISEPAKWDSLSQMWKWLARKFPTHTALRDPHRLFAQDITYANLYEQIINFASALQSLGIMTDDKISLLSENSSRWLIADQGIIAAGAINAVRGSNTPTDELTYIICHSDSKALVVEDISTLDKLAGYINDSNIRFVIVLWGKDKEHNLDLNIPVYFYEDIIRIGEDNSYNEPEWDKNSVATIIYTSGTTGRPKGAMITHANLLYQINAFHNAVKAREKDRVVTILPIWHAYERTCEYYLLSRGGELIYSNLKTFKLDLVKYKPQILIGVPRLWESIYEGVIDKLNNLPPITKKLVNTILAKSRDYISARRLFCRMDISTPNPSKSDSIKALTEMALLYPIYKLADTLVFKKARQAFGGEFRTGISGGGALTPQLDDFFEAAKVDLLVGYGLTETSPVLTVRTLSRNLRASAGTPLVGTYIKIVNPDSFLPVKDTGKGLILAKGPQVMSGYYNDKPSTDAVLSKDGWFNTGDIGWLTEKYDLILTGRVKDLIVLSNGEKVEPQPIEDICMQSPYIKQIVLTGQDKKHLGALIVPNAQSLAKKFGIDEVEMQSKEVLTLLKNELNHLVQNRTNYRSFERIVSFKCVPEPFTIENGMLTRTLKIKKNEVFKKYENLILEMFCA